MIISTMIMIIRMIKNNNKDNDYDCVNNIENRIQITNEDDNNDNSMIDNSKESI